MLKLCDIRARNINQWPIHLNNAIRDERSHAKMVILHSNAFKVTPGEGQCPEVLVNRLQQRLSRRKMETSGASMLIASVAVNSYIVSEKSFASAAKGLDCEHIAFFHALSGSSFDEGNLFVAMDLVAQDIVASDVSNRFDRDDLSVELNFVALHYFLDRFTDVIHPGIDTSFLSNSFSFADRMQDIFDYLEPRIGSCLDSRKQIIIGWIESYGKSTIDNPAADMNSEIHFQDIIVLEDNLLRSGVGSPVSTYVVQAEPGGKSHTGLESVSGFKTLVFGQCSNAILNLLGELAHGDAGPRDRLRILADLAMDFGSFAIVV